MIPFAPWCISCLEHEATEVIAAMATIPAHKQDSIVLNGAGEIQENNQISLAQITAALVT